MHRETRRLVQVDSCLIMVDQPDAFDAQGRCLRMTQMSVRYGTYRAVVDTAG